MALRLFHRMNRISVRNRIALFPALLLCLFAPALLAQQVPPMSATQIPQSALIQAAQLNQELHAPAAQRPLIFQVGSRMLFDEAHIPGAIYAGPDSQPSGQQSLRNQVEHLPRSRSIVVYCGCCPWTQCPNIGPAWTLLHNMGFTNVRALYLPDNFGTDWVAHNYPVQRSH